MRSRPKALGWTSLVTLLAALHVAPAAEAASAARQCRRACRDKIGVCIGVGGRPRVCRKNVLGRCKQAGVGVCQNPAGSPGISPGQVFQQTPAVSGTATIQTCGDVNGDGIVNIGDALVVAEFDVGLRQCSQLIHPEACDVNGDGACNIDDALRIAQCDVGLISCAFTCGPFRCPSTTSTTTTTSTTRPPATTTTTRPSGAIRTVFLILMENTDWSSIKGSSSAPYINRTLLPAASHAEQYYNPPNMHPSLPNYLWLEAGTNFGIFDDNDPSQNAQSTSSHLVNLLEAARISWKTYQEDEGSGAFDGTYCPIGNDGNYYDVNHNPFVYFDDVTNNTSSTATRCIQHVRPYSEFLTDLVNNTVPRYNFIVPDLCHDMHEGISCSQTNRVLYGDTWLSTEVPKILASQAYLNNGALFITWDEGASGDGPIGMIVLSPKAKGRGYANTVAYDHSSTLRTVEEIFGVAPMLGGAASATDLRDLFVSFP